MDMTYPSSFSSDRPAVGRAGGGATNAPAVAATGAWEATPEDAVNFVQMVKDAFKERHPDKYHLFHRIMDDYRSHRIGIAEVASAAEALFQDNPHLAAGFNAFLPMGHRIQVKIDELAAHFIRDINLDDDDGAGGH